MSISVDGHCRSAGADGASESTVAEAKATALKNSMWEIHVVVKDTGIGIPENRRNALFQVSMFLGHGHVRGCLGKVLAFRMWPDLWALNLV